MNRPEPLNAYYPEDALRDGEEGTTIVSLTIDADGRSTGCAIAKSSGSESLDKASCDVAMERLKFEPALKNGEPVEGTYKQAFRWEIDE